MWIWGRGYLKGAAFQAGGARGEPRTLVLIPAIACGVQLLSPPPVILIVDFGFSLLLFFIYVTNLESFKYLILMLILTLAINSHCEVTWIRYEYGIFGV